MRIPCCILAVLAILGLPALAAEAPAAEPQRPPTHANVSYGPHERQVLDFWKAESDQPTPLLFHIHGGGWVAGDKRLVANLEKYLAAGISVVSINYRYSTQAQLAGVKPPVEWPISDAARALQFVRRQAAEWNLDKARIGASGTSAGACSSLWLALHNDLAEPRSADPVARESTRLWCAAVIGAQTSLDPQQLKEWTPNSRYGGHAFGFMPDPRDNKTRDTQFAEFLAARESILPWIKKYSPIEHVTADDPPIYMIYATAPVLGEEQKDPTHTANYGVKLQEKLRSVGVASELVYPGAPEVKHLQVHDYLIEKLKAAPTRKLPPAAKKAAGPALPKPTLADVRYGEHERNVLDFWKAESTKPTPVLFFIHGGGWNAGDKARVANLGQYLAAGISVVSINYRYVPQARAAGVTPPVKAPLHDAARALQFVRSKATEWNLDKARIGASGGSAGACSSLWLAFHPDLADAQSKDPIARESTRLWCAAVTGAQTTLDPQQMKEWTPNSKYGGHAFGFTGDKEKNLSQFDEFLAGREKIRAWIAEYSPYALVTADDPTIYLIYPAPPALGQDQKDPTHTSNFGVKLQEKLRSVGVASELVYPGAPEVKHATVLDYLVEKLKAPAVK